MSVSSCAWWTTPAKPSKDGFFEYRDEFLGNYYSGKKP